MGRLSATVAVIEIGLVGPKVESGCWRNVGKWVDVSEEASD
jgi:hypothetical protein